MSNSSFEGLGKSRKRTRRSSGVEALIPRSLMQLDQASDAFLDSGCDDHASIASANEFNEARNGSNSGCVSVVTCWIEGIAHPSLPSSLMPFSALSKSAE